MQVAKANEQDIESAMNLCGLIEALQRGRLPADLADGYDFVYYDEREHAAKVVEHILKVCSGSISRVCFGMAVLLDPINEVVAADSGVLELHPKHVKAAEQRDRLLAALKSVREEIDGPKKPHSSESYLPRHIISGVRAAIAEVEGRANG